MVTPMSNEDTWTVTVEAPRIARIGRQISYGAIAEGFGCKPTVLAKTWFREIVKFEITCDRPDASILAFKIGFNRALADYPAVTILSD